MRHPFIASLSAAAALAALTGMAVAQPALAPPPGPPGAARALDPESPGAPAPRYETDGNANMPRAMNAPGAPNYTQGSGQQTGGPARELIPR